MEDREDARSQGSGESNGPGDGGEDTDLGDYAASLGLDLRRHPDLAWVAQEAFGHPLPELWSEHVDSEGRVYFFNEVSSESTWEHPMDSVYRELLGVVLSANAQAPSAPSSERVSLFHDHLREAHQRALASLEGWSGPYASPAGEYYYYEPTQVSTWISPLIQWENELAVRSRVLCGCFHLDLEQATAGLGDSAASGAGSLGSLNLPLSAVKRDLDDAPKTPSTTRSFHTARSGCSSRSARGSARKVSPRGLSPSPGSAPKVAAFGEEPRGRGASPTQAGEPRKAFALQSPGAGGRSGPADNSDDDALEFTFGRTNPVEMPQVPKGRPP